MQNNITINFLNIQFTQIDCYEITKLREELIFNLKKLSKYIKFNIDQKVINEHIINIVSILEEAISKIYSNFNKTSYYNYKNSDYFKIIDFSLNFLKFLITNNLNKDIYSDFKEYIEKKINNIVYNPQEVIFKYKIYIYLKKEKLILTNDKIYSSLIENEEKFSSEELDNFIKLNYKQVIAYIINNYENIVSYPFSINEEMFLELKEKLALLNKEEEKKYLNKIGY